jgi:hypothetical protein
MVIVTPDMVFSGLFHRILSEIYFGNFLKVLEIKKLLTIFGCLFVKIFQMKFLLASLKLLTNCENPSRNRIQEVCSSFPLAICHCKSCKAACDLEFVPKAGYECTYTVHWYGILEKIDP